MPTIDGQAILAALVVFDSGAASALAAALGMVAGDRRAAGRVRLASALGAALAASAALVLLALMPAVLR